MDRRCLLAAVQKHHGKNWAAIVAFGPHIQLTKIQCTNRWHSALNPNIDRTAAQTDIWTPTEEEALQKAVEKFHGKKWDAIADIVRVERRNNARVDGAMSWIPKSYWFVVERK
jgi:hypothetical protein